MVLQIAAGIVTAVLVLFFLVVAVGQYEDWRQDQRTIERTKREECRARES